MLIGFAAETDDVIAHAREKLSRKRLDYILANDVTAEGSGFMTDTNTLRLISHDSEQVFSGLKEDAAFDIWSALNAG